MWACLSKRRLQGDQCERAARHPCCRPPAPTPRIGRVPRVLSHESGATSPPCPTVVARGPGARVRAGLLRSSTRGLRRGREGEGVTGANGSGGRRPAVGGRRGPGTVTLHPSAIVHPDGGDRGEGGVIASLRIGTPLFEAQARAGRSRQLNSNKTKCPRRQHAILQGVRKTHIAESRPILCQVRRDNAVGRIRRATG